MIEGRLIAMAAGVSLDVSPADTVVAAAAGGFDAAGIWFDATTWTDDTAREVRRRLDDTGLVAMDIEPVILRADGDHGDALVDAALAVGARHVLVANRGADRARVLDRFASLCDRAAPGGVTVVLEFVSVFPLRLLADAVSIVTEAGRANGGVLVDNLHLARTGGLPADVAAVATPSPGLFPYLQLSDAPAAPPDDLYPEASDGRLLPGEGGLPLREVLAAIPHVPISVELRSAELRRRHPDPADRARAVWAATKAVLEPAGPAAPTLS